MLPEVGPTVGGNDLTVRPQNHSGVVTKVEVVAAALNKNVKSSDVQAN